MYPQFHFFVSLVKFDQNIPLEFGYLNKTDLLALTG